MAKIVKCIRVLDDVTATTTSSPVRITGAKKVVLVCERTNNAGGTSSFAATVAVEDELGNVSDYVTYNKWIDNVTNTNSQALTRVAAKAIAASNGTVFLTMSPEDGFDWIKVTVTETADGTHSAWLYVEHEE